MVKFWARFKFALAGITYAFKSQANFRTQLVLGLGAVSLLVYFDAEPLWWAAFFLVIAGVLAAEVANTALEALADALHPEVHPLVGRAKDCAAGAVLIWSLASLCILGFFLYHHIS